MAARLGLVGIAFNYPFLGIEQMGAAAGEIERVLGLVREHDRVDPDRIGLVGVLGAGALAGRFVARPAEWLRAVALTYPDCRRDDEDDDWPTTLAEGVEQSSDLPILLTRVGRELPALLTPSSRGGRGRGGVVDSLRHRARHIRRRPLHRAGEHAPGSR